MDQADRHRLDGKFEVALELMDELLTAEGKAFEEQRERAQALRERTVNERRAAASRAFAEGRRLVREQRFKEAIDMFRRVPPDIRDTSEAIEGAKEYQARVAAERRSKATTNLILIVLAVVLVLVVLLAFALGG